MKTIKVSEATNIQLDWLVAKCEGIPLGPRGFVIYRDGEGDAAGYTPSTDWSQGGPIIEREKIQSGYIATFKEWECRMRGGNRSVGPTMLVAAMRCHVVSKIGDTAEVPDDLTA
jgi:hypothetical protein